MQPSLVIAKYISFLLLGATLVCAGRAFAINPGDVVAAIPEQSRLAEPPANIALLLPSSGPFAKTAVALRDGFFAAYYQRLNKLYQPTIRLYDAGTQPAAVLAAYRQALAEGANVVIGPLDKDGVKALARSADLAVPTLTLNYAEDENAKPGNLFQFGLAPEDEARAVAERAWQDGRRQAVALIPVGEWGARVFNTFKARFEELGGSVVAQQTYDPAGSDFATPVRTLFNISSKERRRRQDVDALFMVAFPRQARQIRPQLNFNFAGDVPVYATSHVYTGRIDKNADTDVNDVLFCDMPWVLEEGQQALSRIISQRWPQSADQFKRLYALGVDAYNLLPYLSRMRADPSERMAGETGNLSLDKGQRIHRALVCARFVDGEPRIIAQP
ncbi:MAG: penicillin-binding protein activator [Gammaproteobacteria bacterium]